MGLDDRDYMRERERARQRARDWSINARRGGRPSDSFGQWIAKVFIWLVIALVLFSVFKQFETRRTQRPELTRTWADFPLTGHVRWFIAPSSDPGSLAPLSITGARDVRTNVIVRLDNWDTRAPVAIIPIRGGETANIQIPLGRYRLVYSADTEWNGDAKMLGNVQEAIEPLEFYRTGTQVIGQNVDLNGRLNGNMKTKPAGFF